MKKKICIGTRASNLALWQAEFVKSKIKQFFPDIDIKLKTIKTKGDKIIDRPLALVGGKGLFVKEIENALLDKNIDIAVHSMKDMPSELPFGLVIASILERENPFDVLVAKNNILLADYKKKAIIGTSSLRRKSQLKHIRPDLVIKSVRGNLETRLKKLETNDYDAIVLAAAGLLRLGYQDKITEYLNETSMIPAAGQGTLCIEARKDDKNIFKITKKLDHYKTKVCVLGERAFLKQIEGSCHIPVACFAKFVGEKVVLTGMAASEDGKRLIKLKKQALPSETKKKGKLLAKEILEKGGKKILESLN